MRVWYQSLIDGERLPAYFEGLEKRAAAIARPGVQVDFHSMPANTYGGETPADVVIYPYLMSLHIQFILDNALRAQDEGYDVFAVGSVQDPGIEEVRSLVDIPVVGYGESAMHFACCLGSRFTVLAFQNAFDQLMDRRVKALGLSERALPTLLVDVGFDDVHRGLQNETEFLLERFHVSARRAIALGAEALIPGQLYLSEAIARAGITRIDEVPIMDGLACTLKMAEAMYDLKRLGIGVTRRGYTHARPPDRMIDHVRSMHGRAPRVKPHRSS